MSSLNGPTRRTFLKMAWGTVAVLTCPVPALARVAREASAAETNGWSGAPGMARYRFEGMAKVFGQKIYARDFRVRDMEGWPSTQRMALVLRARYADRPFLSYDLSVLPEDLQPLAAVDAERLAKDDIQNLYPDTSPQGRPPGMMVASKQVPVYLGQPLAILIFRDAAAYRAAHRRLEFNPKAVLYGKPVSQPPLATPYSPPTYLTRYAGPDGDLFSQVLDGVTNPFAEHPSSQDREARRWRARIEEETKNGSWQNFNAKGSTQVLDPVFMEPEAGLAWLDRRPATLHLVLGTQSTNGDLSDAIDLFAKTTGIKVETVRLTPCYPGGGFGGRDTSAFPPLLMLAAAYADAPVRMALDRFEQFQAGLKQLGANIEQSVSVDASGNFQALRVVQRMQAGGKNNYSQFVAQLAGYTAGGGYVWPRVAVNATAQPTFGVVAGSMRGFGGPQAAFGLETLIDEVAQKLGRDAIDLRRQNALKEGDRTVTGAPLDEPMRIVEICARASRNPLWTGREAEKARRAAAGGLYGVGFALANQAYGTSGDGVMANVALSADGRITVETNCVDMGNGSATTLALIPARHLGHNAHDIRMGEVILFDSLELSNCSSSHGRRTNHHPWDDPRYTASFSMSSSACITAFQQVHAVDQASRVLWRTALWPAACALWGLDPSTPTASQEAGWEDGCLVVSGQPPLPIARIAAQLHTAGGVVAAMVHAYYSTRWVKATYDVDGTIGHWEIDGLSTRTAGSPEYRFHPRRNVRPPPSNSKDYGRSLYAPSASLVALEVDSQSGQVTLQDVWGYLDAGSVLQEDLLSGQYQGGVAMGIGYALLEDVPIGNDGAGRGDWNLNRYHVALARDLPLERIRLELLPPLAPDAPAKGIAEAVLCPIAPAIANAVAHATGKRFPSIPITAGQIREALRG